jgi:hypothetical protein
VGDKELDRREGRKRFPEIRGEQSHRSSGQRAIIGQFEDRRIESKQGDDHEAQSRVAKLQREVVGECEPATRS